MNHKLPIARTMRTTYRTSVREIAQALGILVGANQWVALEDGDGDGIEQALTGTVDVVRWERMLIHPETDQASPQ